MRQHSIMSPLTDAGPVPRSSKAPTPEGRRLRILHVVTPGVIGGLERVTQALCIGLRRRRHAVEVAAVGQTEEALEPFLAPLAAAAVPLHRIILPPRSYLKERRAIAQLAAAVQPDVVHTHGYRADIVAGWAARRAGLPTVTTLHGFTATDWKNRLYEGLQRATLARFDGVAAVSQPLAEQVARSAAVRPRVRVIPNGWLESEAPLGRAAARNALGLGPTDHAVVGWVGRLSREKGLDLALRALALLDDVRVILLVVGDGPERAECERLAARLGLTERVRWCGQVPDAGRLFGAFDVFLSSSRTEGTPIVLFEAMATRTPIVATAVGGVPDVLPQGTALVIPPGDPQGLAQAIGNVLRYPRHATARATAARTRLLTHYEPQRWLDAYEELYRQVGGFDLPAAPA